MPPEIKIHHQNRRNLMMRPTLHGVVEVYVPLWLKKDSRQVRQFIEAGLLKLEGHIPERPATVSSPDAIRQMVADWGEKMGLHPQRVTLRPMRRKWGSCSSRENITLNTALCWLPVKLAEYVVVHELAHLKVFNHGKAFQALLSEHLPDWRLREKHLRAYRL